MSNAATLVFSAGTALGGLPLQLVEETMRPLPVESWSGGLACIDGISIVRGAPAPVINVEALLSGRRGTLGRFIAVRAGAGRAVLAVETVLGIWPTERLGLAPLPPLLDGQLAATIDAVGRLDAQLLLVLRAAQLVPPDVWQALAAREAVA